MAATSWTHLRSTPHSSVWRIDSKDEGGTTIVDYATDMAHHLVEGPLKTKLARLNAVSQLDRLNIPFGARVRIYPVFGIDENLVPAALHTLVWGPTGLAATMPAGAEGNFVLVIEFKFIHSIKDAGIDQPVPPR